MAEIARGGRRRQKGENAQNRQGRIPDIYFRLRDIRRAEISNFGLAERGDLLIGFDWNPEHSRCINSECKRGNKLSIAVMFSFLRSVTRFFLAPLMLLCRSRIFRSS
jgi:hypothetical protein